ISRSGLVSECRKSSREWIIRSAVITREQPVDDVLVNLDFAFLGEGIAHALLKEGIAGPAFFGLDLVANCKALAGQAGWIDGDFLHHLAHDFRIDRKSTRLNSSH